MVEATDPFGFLKTFPQFLNWRLIGGKKFATDPKSGAIVDPNDRSYWCQFDEAEKSGKNIAFVFSNDDPFFFIDVDDCFSSTTGKWSDTANLLCGLFKGCAIEVSQSNEGLHIIGTQPEHIPHSCVNNEIGTQFYTEKRFVALTFNMATGDTSFTPNTSTYLFFINNYFPEKIKLIDVEWSTEPTPEYTGPDDDKQLIKKMLKSKSAGAEFGGRASLRSLWNADSAELRKFYPDQRRDFDNSEADLALCCHLSFWTGKNCERIDRLFRKSKLYRDKWERDGYRVNTVCRAVGLCKNVYSIPPVIPSEDNIFMTVEAQKDYFDGCVYIQDMHKIFIPDGSIIGPDVFKVVYSKNKIFHLDTRNDKTTRNAWKAYTESEVNFPEVVHSTCFRPEISPGGIVDDEGRRMVNTYVPIKTKSRKGDITPFLLYLEKMLPNAKDRDIMLTYLSACVRNPGKKFQWCVVTQGTYGNGKTMLGSFVSKAIGERYTHWPNALDLANKFNGWIENRLFIIVEEIYVPRKPEIMETLKTLITGERLEIHKKGEQQYAGDNRANFYMSTNYMDGIQKTIDDRRHCVFFTAQQSKRDIIRDNMGGDYFPKLYGWARECGYDYVSHFLKHEYEIKEEYNPAGGCQWAPDTSTTGDVLIMSRPPEEQEVVEAILEGRSGFSNGWISSIMLTKLLEKYRLSNTKRAEIIFKLGYQVHPGLNDGRLTSTIIEEGGKPRLYVRQNSVMCNLSQPLAIKDRYCKDQGYFFDGGSSNEKTA